MSLERTGVVTIKPGAEFWIVDVFAERKHAGNQLAVVLDDGSISDDEMQRIACEMHFSETTFVKPSPCPDGSFTTRVFTPSEEVPFAGHPTLGTAFVIRHALGKNGGKTIVLRERGGPIPVTFAPGEEGDDEIAWMVQKSPVFGREHGRTSFAPVVGLDVSAIDDRFPVQEVSTGLPFTIVPIKNLAAMRRSRVVKEAYDAFTATTDAKGLLLFCPEVYDKACQVNVRMFADAYGIAEDPATGSGNGCLAAYLVKHRYFNDASINIRAEQGMEIGRPSRLYLKARDAGGTIDVNVGGKVILVANGTLW
ncbi:MAG: PhzF family phenazine biosynthesis protein [Candidatus Lokiarchaeota archaeon]|nr:PhzF family phenazine biosynthesis protein [Candidatus Lokiarchaeota archaeon]